jgi:hypothetical protein
MDIGLILSLDDGRSRQEAPHEEDYMVKRAIRNESRNQTDRYHCRHQLQLWRRGGWLSQHEADDSAPKHAKLDTAQTPSFELWSEKAKLNSEFLMPPSSTNSILAG